MRLCLGPAPPSRGTWCLVFSRFGGACYCTLTELKKLYEIAILLFDMDGRRHLGEHDKHMTL